LIVDNTFGPPLSFPSFNTANVVVESATKWIGGHGTSIGGAIADGGNYLGQRKFPDLQPSEGYHGLIFWNIFEKKSARAPNAFAIRARGRSA
jgi:O-acetylhomoserine (thiol)-lyase